MALAPVDNGVVSPAEGLATELALLVPGWSVAWPDNRYIAVVERSDDPRSAAIVPRDGHWVIEWTGGPAIPVGPASNEVLAAEIARHLERSPVPER